MDQNEINIMTNEKCVCEHNTGERGQDQMIWLHFDFVAKIYNCLHLSKKIIHDSRTMFLFRDISSAQ